MKTIRQKSIHWQRLRKQTNQFFQIKGEKKKTKDYYRGHLHHATSLLKSWWVHSLLKINAKSLHWPTRPYELAPWYSHTLSLTILLFSSRQTHWVPRQSFLVSADADMPVPQVSPYSTPYLLQVFAQVLSSVWELSWSPYLML